MLSKYKITVCILHFRKIKQLKKTIADLLANTVTPIKIKLLNQGYLDGEITSYLQQLESLDNVEIIYGKTNIGCSPGRNLLTHDIDTPFIMILDDDIYVSKNWDIPVMEYFDTHPKIGAIGFSLYKTNAKFWFTGGQYLNLKGKTITAKRPFLDPQTTSQEFITVDDICAGAMIYRSELQNIIPWDKNYFIAFEDLEKAVYLKRSGYQCAVSIQSKFIHDKVSEQKEFREYNKDRRNYHAMRKAYLHFLTKNGLRMELKRHIFYKFFCLLPESFLRNFSYFWLKLKSRD